MESISVLLVSRILNGIIYVNLLQVPGVSDHLRL